MKRTRSISLFLVICFLFIQSLFPVSGNGFSTDANIPICTTESETRDYLPFDSISLSVATSSTMQTLSEVILSRSTCCDNHDDDDMWVDWDGDNQVDCPIEVVSAESTTILTPNNVTVTVSNVIGEWDISILNSVDSSMAEGYQVAIKLDGATAKYNCHSYAWYSQEYSNNTYWMNYPQAYYQSAGSVYVETITPATGDIICYFDSAGNNMHSGIVVSVTSGTSNEVCGNSNLVTVQSKWGQAGLYEHRGDQCPYPGIGAVSVKYYRRANHSHTFSYTSCNIDGYHKKYCTGCGVTIWEDHYVYTIIDYDESEHSLMCRCGLTWTENHDFWDYDDETHGGECNICDYYADYVSHSYTYVDEGDGTHTGSCMYCDHTVSGSHTTECIDLNANNHAFSCTSCSYYTTSAHIWLTRTNAQGEKYYYCSVCGRISYFLQLNSQTLVILSADEQRALTAAVKGADGDFVLYLDAETGILYLDGELYIFTVPADTVVSSYLEPVAVDDATLSLLPPLPDTETE